MEQSAGRQVVYLRLEELGIPFELEEHPPVYTIEEMEQLGIGRSGQVCKNLFLRDDKGKRYFLLSLMKHKRVDLSTLREQIGCSRMGFASAKRLEEHLGLHQGEVSPFGLLNDREARVEVLLDSELVGNPRLGFHPNDNTATVWITYDALCKVIRENGNPLQLVQV